MVIPLIPSLLSCKHLWPVWVVRYLWGRTIEKTGNHYWYTEISNPWNISRFSVYSHIQLTTYLFLVASLATKFIFPCGGAKNGSSIFNYLIPTIFIGPTYPVMRKYFETEDANLSQQVNYLYSINTLLQLGQHDRD